MTEPRSDEKFEKQEKEREKEEKITDGVHGRLPPRGKATIDQIHPDMALMIMTKGRPEHRVSPKEHNRDVVGPMRRPRKEITHKDIIPD